MKYMLTLLMLLNLSVTNAQTNIQPETIAEHVGDSVSLTAKVYSTRYFENAKDAPTLLNLGAAFPHQLLTVVIYGTERKNFSEAPENFYKDKTIRITGKVELYKGKPQIVAKTSSQILVLPEQAN